MNTNFNTMCIRDKKQSIEGYSASIQEIEEVYADEFMGGGGLR